MKIKKVDDGHDWILPFLTFLAHVKVKYIFENPLLETLRI